MSSKLALVIANTEYDDPGLARLSAPSKDAQDFARILMDKNLCGFDDVKMLINRPEPVIREAIDEFFDKKKPDDLLVFYFSGHGVRDEMGSLYLAVKNTVHTRLRSTAIKSDFIREAMDQSRSKRQVLILDCCNSGAFAQGTKAVTGGSVGTATAFEGTGFGRVVLTASDATQFAWEGDKVIGETDNSLFTHFLVKGLEGEADANGDGQITIDELYDYAYGQIVNVTPKQTPGKWSYKQQGEIILRQMTKLADIKPADLPKDLLEATENILPYVREGAVKQLGELLKGKNIRLARAAQDRLERMVASDDSRTVVMTAQQILDEAGVAKPKPVSDPLAERERLMRERAQAVQLAREHERKQLAQAKPATASPAVPLPVGGVAQPRAGDGASQPGQVSQKKKSGLLTWLMLAGGGILCIVMITVGPLVWKAIFPPTTTAQPIAPTAKTDTDFIMGLTLTSEAKTAEVFVPPTGIPFPTATDTVIPSPTFTLTFTVTPSPTITPLATTEPVAFLTYYFDIVIRNKDFNTGWSLLTPEYQVGKAVDWPTYTSFWSRTSSWSLDYVKVIYEHSDRALVNFVYTIYYNDGTNPSKLPSDTKYCLLWSNVINTWQIDMRNNCP